MNLIFFQTKTYFANTGDVLINNALINTLRQHGMLYANCSDEIPAEFVRELNLAENERIRVKNEMRFISVVLRTAISNKRTGNKVFVFSGLGDMYGGGMKPVIRNIASGMLFPLLRMFGVRIIRIGRSIGPLTKPMAISERIRSWALTRYYVRDSKSLQRAHEIGIEKARFCPDMSWLYEMHHDRRVNMTNKVVVNLRNAIFDDAPAEFREKTLAKCEEILEQLRKKIGDSMEVYVAHQINEDALFSKEVFNRIRNQYSVRFVEKKMSLSDLKAVYGNADYLVSNRMHALLSGYKYGALPIALIDVETHTKISATLKDACLDALMIDIYSADVRSSVDELVDNRSEYMQALFSYEVQAQDEIDTVLKDVFLSA